MGTFGALDKAEAQQRKYCGPRLDGGRARDSSGAQPSKIRQDLLYRLDYRRSCVMYIVSSSSAEEQEACAAVRIGQRLDLYCRQIDRQTQTCTLLVTRRPETDRE